MSDKDIVPLIAADTIAERVRALAREIAQASAKTLTAVVALDGAFVFAADLLRALKAEGVALKVHTLRLASYGQGTSAAGAVTAEDAARLEIAGEDVLLIDDIVDSGHTLAKARAILQERGAKRVRAVALLDKPSRRQANERAEYAGFTIEDVFVVGYGMDLAGRYRELPFIGTIKA